MKYALLIYTNGAGEFADLPRDEQEAIAGEYAAIMQAPGVYGGEQVQPPEAATTVRSGAGQPVITPGPVAETNDGFGGFYLLEADGPEAAIEVASRIPAVRMGGAVEIRPLVAA
jgi:hypothetical protein